MTYRVLFNNQDCYYVAQLAVDGRWWYLMSTFSRIDAECAGLNEAIAYCQRQWVYR